jgi:hypothetical protein
VPAKPTWLLRVPEILEVLNESPVPFLTRAAIESVFQLQRRQAIYLMRRLGGYQIGKALVVDRQRLRTWLKGVAAGNELRWESVRHQRVEETIEQVRADLAARRIVIQVPSQSVNTTIEGLPPNISLRPGELKIEFNGTEDLLRQLFQLSQAIANDYTRFSKLIEQGY